MGSNPPHAETEDAIRAACDRGDYGRATTIALRAYGPAILGWLIHRLRSEGRGADAFALFAEDLWSGWRGFEWRCSARAWAYILARNAANRHAVAARRDAEGRITLSRADVARAAREVRTSTLPYLRTEVKDEFRALRDRLSADDQLILVLRVDRRMSWAEVAHVTLDDAEVAGEGLAREVTRLRKRLQLIKRKLRALAVESGLIPNDGVADDR